ncbi:MAG: cytochrome c3 family protein [Deltaproteobacteria bacterium]|nr:cytochrome c3 family protein [Deltaproteobacteria bacterium]
MKDMRSKLKMLLLAVFWVMFGFLSTGVADEFTQPIAFSHKTHAGTNEIPCEFCHTYARRSINSGAPSVESCIGWHSVVEGAKDDQKEEIKKAIQYWEKRQPIPWKKIHDVPDFVHFSHKRHIKVGFDCTECHGDIAQIDVISMKIMFADLSMGWCMQCHTKNHPVVKGQVSGPIRQTRGGAIVPGSVNQTPDGSLLGSKDCYVCHK